MKLRISILVVVACGVGLALFLQGGQADPLSAGDDSHTQWLCKSCAHDFLLTARQVAQQADRDPQHWAPLKCPQCRQKQAYLAMVCPQCRTIYFGRDVPGESGQCPKCSPGSPTVVADSDRSREELPRPPDKSAAAKPAAKVR
ncbi:MAG TPA: hypothetical protein VJZ71_08675 [Phycisphaerae bacterium]|nr:hypothetical protein [Phycisphaerae bacterium]